MSISTAISQSVTDHMWSADSTKAGNAVEKWKAKNGLPTFPPRRRLLRLPSPNPKNRRLAPPEKSKADRSRVNQSGQIDLLTTAGALRANYDLPKRSIARGFTGDIPQVVHGAQFFRYLAQ